MSAEHPDHASMADPAPDQLTIAAQGEIISTVHGRPSPTISASAGLIMRR